MLVFDHIALSATDLASGAAFVEDILGVPLVPGGDHALMGTHNRLLGMGDLYLEVIAINPAAPAPPRPRWFDLDSFSGKTRLTNWVLRSESLIDDLASCTENLGKPLGFERGPYRWDMAVPDDGRLPFDGAFPALIQWHGPRHPTAALPDSGVRLTRLELQHPRAAALRAALPRGFADPRVVVMEGATIALSARFATPHGPRTLQ
jgi:hypothetical protein